MAELQAEFILEPTMALLLVSVGEVGYTCETLAICKTPHRRFTFGMVPFAVP